MPALSPRKVMLVDDGRAAVSSGLAALQASGYSAVGFTNPALALAEFRKHARQYVLVVSDIRMPGMSGFELARRICEIKHRSIAHGKLPNFGTGAVGQDRWSSEATLFPAMI